MPPSLCSARKTKELCFIISHWNSSALHEFPQHPICYAPPTMCCKKKPSQHTLQSSSFLFFFTKLQPPFSFPSSWSLLALPWDLLGSLIGGFSLSKNQRTIFNLEIIKLINLDALRGTVCCCCFFLFGFCLFSLCRRQPSRWTWNRTRRS